jgi:hypothetical protein
MSCVGVDAPLCFCWGCVSFSDLPGSPSLYLLESSPWLRGVPCPTEPPGQEIEQVVEERYRQPLVRGTERFPPPLESLNFEEKSLLIDFSPTNSGLACCWVGMCWATPLLPSHPPFVSDGLECHHRIPFLRSFLTLFSLPSPTSLPTMWSFLETSQHSLRLESLKNDWEFCAFRG